MASGLPIQLQNPITGDLYTADSGVSTSVATGQVAATTTPAQLVPTRSGRSRITISPVNNTTTPYLIGTSAAMTPANSLYVAPGVITIHTSAPLFVATTTGTLTLSFIESFG